MIFLPLSVTILTAAAALVFALACVLDALGLQSGPCYSLAGGFVFGAALAAGAALSQV